MILRHRACPTKSKTHKWTKHSISNSDSLLKVYIPTVTMISKSWQPRAQRVSLMKPTVQRKMKRVNSVTNGDGPTNVHIPAMTTISWGIVGHHVHKE